jgi:hypothetical protein
MISLEHVLRIFDFKLQIISEGVEVSKEGHGVGGFLNERLGTDLEGEDLTKGCDVTAALG